MISTVMHSATLTRTLEAAELAGVPPAVQQQLRAQAAQIEALSAQIEWFKRQLFGRKSERYAPEPDAQQLHLGELMEQPQQPAAPAEQDVLAHKRRKPRSDFADDGAVASFFDEAKVPVQTIEVPNPEVQGLSPDQYEVIGEKVSHRLAQRPGSYVVLSGTLPQAQFLVAHAIPRRTVDAQWVLEVLAYWQDANYRAYRSHRKRRMAHLNQRE